MLPYSLCLLEHSLDIICVCVMELRPFCRRHLPFLLGSKGSRRTGDSPGASGSLNFDGPSGPNSKSAYRTKVSSGNKTGLYGGPMRSGKRRYVISGAHHTTIPHYSHPVNLSEDRGGHTIPLLYKKPKIAQTMQFRDPRRIFIL